MPNIKTNSRASVLRLFMTAACLVILAGCGPGPDITPASTPTGLAASASDATVVLTWSASTAASGYHVKRATTSGGPYTQLAAPASVGYTDSSVNNGTTYYYVVSALNSTGESSNSAEVSATPRAPSAPNAPSGLEAIAGNSQVTLSWVASDGTTSYYVKRSSVSGGPYTRIATPASTSYTDTSVTNDTTYYYVVSAVNAIGESPNSTPVRVTPALPPPTTFGTWTNVTPAGLVLNTTLPCSNYGASSVAADPLRPSDLYTQVNCQGIWKSTDYGATWSGPINTGTNAALAIACSGGATVAAGTAGTPIIYQSCIRGDGIGFWKSIDGGVNWRRIPVTPTTRQDYSFAAIDPYDSNHLLMTGHEFDSTVESTDGGESWTSVRLENGMLQINGQASIQFVNTGNAGTTRGNWLWVAEASGGAHGTWLTTDGGATWTQVDKNEQFGNLQIYQPNNNGVLYMAGVYSDLGWGVLRSADYGRTWTHVGASGARSLVFGTSRYVYAMVGTPVGPGGIEDSGFEVANQPGTGQWVAPGTPAEMTQGPAQVAVVNDGTHTYVVGAMRNGGVWRYAEP